MSLWLGVLGGQPTVPPLSMSYSSAYMQVGSNSPTVSPTVTGGDGSTKTYSYSGTLPTGVGFSTTTGTFTGPSSSSWSAISEVVSASSNHACLVTSSGELRCWGSNSSYQLGDGSSTTTSTTTFVNPTGLSSGVSSVSVGGSPASCAVTTAGGLKCWGKIDFNALNTNFTTPTDVTGLTSGVVSVSVGNNVAAALTTSGEVKAWGWDGGYNSGMNAPFSSPVTPVAAGSGLVTISCGGSHCCGITSSGGAKCWGYGAYGQIGNGSTSNANGYSDVTGLTSGVVSISAGYRHSCAVTTAGEVKCWGYNAQGQLGDGTTTNRTTPVTVSGFSSGGASVFVSSGDYNPTTCVVQTTGGVKCWGTGGPIGSGAFSSTTPVQVSGLSSGVTSVSVGSQSACAQTTSGQVYCWGSGFISSAATPVLKTGTGPHPGFPASITATVTDSSSSSSTSISLQALVPPSPPTNLTVSVSSNTASLSWSAPTKTYGSSVTGYNVSYSTSSASGPWTSHTSGQAGTTATIGSLTPGSTYWFKVEAVTAAAIGTPAVATAINYGTPGAPTNVTASSAYQALTFSWTAPTNTGGGISDYKLQHSSDNSTWTTISDGVSTATSYTISGLSNNQTVYFRVAASNPSGDGAYSASASGTTLNPKASGGTITYSGGKFIHTFTTSGTFAPTTSISATALCVAGGYNGATATSNASGAGGAGGQVVTGTQTVSTTRTIAVGSVGGGTSSISGWISASGVGVAGGASKTVQGTGNNGTNGTLSSIDGAENRYYGSSGGSGGYVSDQVNYVYFFGGNGGSGAGAGGFAGGKMYYNYNWPGNPAVNPGCGGGGGAASAGVAPAAGGAGAAGIVVISYT